jgi:hypothetical protein
MEDIVAPFTCEKQAPAGHFLDFTYAGSVGQVHAYDQFTKGQPFYTTPLAAPVQDDPDEQVIRERDEAEAIADALAEKIAAITGCEIGEHTSANSPWHSALDAADEFLASRPPEAPVQELVLWMDSGDDVFHMEEDAYKVGFQPIRPLYTSPPNVATPLDDTPHLAAQRPVPQERKWVGLTDDQIDALDCVHLLWREDDPVEIHGIKKFARAIEAKLKEKNSCSN